MAETGRPGVDLDAFFRQVRRARKRALLLDYDGTLAPFRVERGEAVPYPGVRELLQAIGEAGHTRVVVISGRQARELVPLLAVEPLPEIWGTHGWERLMPGGAYELAPLLGPAAAGLAEAAAWIEAQGWAERCERKPAAVALHWRGLAPEAIEAMRGETRGRWQELAAQARLEVHEFDGGLELRVPGRDKGSTVVQLLQELGEGAVVAFLGDDRTDEDAFRAIKGKGLGILVRPEHRPTAAELWLRPPEELLDFLRRWDNACAGAADV